MTLPISLKHSIKEILVQSLGEMKNSINSRTFASWKVVTQISIEGEGSSSKSDKIEPDFSSLALIVIESITKKPIFETFQKIIESNELTGGQLNKLVGTSEGMFRLTDVDILRSALIKYLHYNNLRLDFEEESFEKVCNDIYLLFSSTYLEIRYQAILENFEMSTVPVELDSGITIRQFRPGEIQEMWNKYPFFQQAYPFWSHHSISPSGLKGLVEIHKSAEKLLDVDLTKVEDQRQRPSLQANRELDLVLTVLRLLKAGSVRYGLIFSRVPYLLGEVFSLSGTPGVRSSFGKRFVLEESDVESLKDIWQIIRGTNLKKNMALTVALRRLNFANERLSEEDKLIDLIIASEALLLSDVGDPQDRGELRHRLSIRAAHLLGQECEEMMKIYKTMKKAYDLRSKVVHGGALNPEECKNVEEFLDICRRAARELVILTSRGKTIDWDRWLFE